MHLNAYSEFRVLSPTVFPIITEVAAYSEFRVSLTFSCINAQWLVGQLQTPGTVDDGIQVGPTPVSFNYLEHGYCVRKTWFGWTPVGGNNLIVIESYSRPLSEFKPTQRQSLASESRLRESIKRALQWKRQP